MNGSATNGRGKKPKKVKRKKRIGLLIPIMLGITAAVAGVCIFYAWDLIQHSSLPIFGDYEVIELPDFTGMQIDEVKVMLRRSPYNYLRLKEDYEYDSAVPAGTVKTQNPTSDNTKQVKANQMVYLTISDGVQIIEVPDLSGMSRKEAISTVREMGLTPYAKPQSSQTVPSGKVIGTEPEAGFQLQNLPGTVLTIYVSGDAKEYERRVPALVGLDSLESAQKVLELVDMSVGQVKEVHSGEPAGKILEQNPLPGTMGSVADLVDVVVSKGPEPPPPEPDPEPTPTPPVTPPPASSSTDEESSSSDETSSEETGGEGGG